MNSKTFLLLSTINFICLISYCYSARKKGGGISLGGRSGTGGNRKRPGLTAGTIQNVKPSDSDITLAVLYPSGSFGQKMYTGAVNNELESINENKRKYPIVAKHKLRPIFVPTDRIMYPRELVDAFCRNITTQKVTFI